MRRILGFLVGAGLVVTLIYWLRRTLGGTPTPTSVSSPSGSTPVKAPEAASTRNAEGKITTRYTVRNSGPRPQAVITDSGDSSTTEEAQSMNGDAISMVGEPQGRHAEPDAATETDAEAASPRSELTEVPLLQDLPVENIQIEDSKSETVEQEETSDFLPIADIGPIFNKRLLEAGIKTYATLAALSAQEIETKTGIPASRIERGRWREQAARLAEGMSAEE